MPLAVAELLLGAGMVVFAQQAAVGRWWARQALVQRTVAHVALSVVEWKATADLRGPEDHFELAYNNLDASEVSEGTLAASALLRLGIGIGISALAVLGLTLPRSRTFYRRETELPQ